MGKTPGIFSFVLRAASGEMEVTPHARSGPGPLRDSGQRVMMLSRLGASFGSQLR